MSIERSVEWQAIETRTGGTANSNVASQTVWSAAYINAAVLQDTYSAGVIQPTSRIYFLQDANWDTTAIVGLVNGSWQVTQRYVYSPYGTITVLNADWPTPPTVTQPLVDNLYQGMTLDSVTGLYYARNRNYDPTLGRWINQDPLQYINGANTYQFVMSNPVGSTDPAGLGVPYSGYTYKQWNTMHPIPVWQPPNWPWWDGLGIAMINGAGQQMDETKQTMDASGEELSPKEQALTMLGAGLLGALKGAAEYVWDRPHCKSAPPPPPPPLLFNPNPWNDRYPVISGPDMPESWFTTSAGSLA